MTAFRQKMPYVPLYVCELTEPVKVPQSHKGVFFALLIPAQISGTHGFPDIKLGFYHWHLTRSSKVLEVFRSGSWRHSVLTDTGS